MRGKKTEDTCPLNTCQGGTCVCGDSCALTNSTQIDLCGNTTNALTICCANGDPYDINLVTSPGPPCSWTGTSINCNSDSTTTTTTSTTCFEGSSSTLLLESGKTIKMAEVEVGDRVQVATKDGSLVFSDVVFIPHAPNDQESEFIHLTTSATEIKMSDRHLLPAGTCGSVLELMDAQDVAVGSCVMTNKGQQEVLTSTPVKGKGVYTVVTADAHGNVMVNGVQASSFAVNHFIPNTYYLVHRNMYHIMPKSFLTSKVVVYCNILVGNVAMYFANVFGA